MVEAEIKPERMAEFLDVMERDAVGSRTEPGCIRFGKKKFDVLCLMFFDVVCLCVLCVAVAVAVLFYYCCVGYRCTVTATATVTAIDTQFYLILCYSIQNRCDPGPEQSMQVLLL